MARLGLVLLLQWSWQTFRLAHLDISLCQPLAGVDKLNDIYDLLGGHDGEADTSDNPRPSGVHLVRTGRLKGCSTEGIGKHLLQNGSIHRDTWLEVTSTGFLNRLDQVRCEKRR